MSLVSIGSRKVPLMLGAGVTELYFMAGVHGKKERGFYRFWTCVGADRFGSIEIIGRARRGLSPGDRFARMHPSRTKRNPPSHRRIYTRMYKRLQASAWYVRPSTEREVARWAEGHKKDMAFARAACLIRGIRYSDLPKAF